MAGRFEPTKSGDYLVEYLVDNQWTNETVHYDRQKNEWSGKMTADFYRQDVVSWYY